MKGLKSIVNAAVRLPLRAIPKGTVVPVLSGQLRGARWVVGRGTEGCWLGTYEPLTRMWLSSLLGPGRVAFDVGANVGFFTLLASRLVGSSGSVVAFEPMPSNVAALRRHVELNQVRNVTIFEAAISDHPGTARFSPSGNPSMGRLAESGNLEVETVSLDGLIGGGVVPEPDLLKIDVEGAEMQVLQGGLRCLREKRPAVVLSAHGWRLFEECRELLEGLDYVLDVAKDGSEDGDYLVIAKGQRA
jgi:FkbM family methyltransferase